MAIHALTTSTTTARRLLPRLGAVTGRRTPEAPRRGLLALLAGMSMMAIPFATTAKGEATTVPPSPTPAGRPVQPPTDLHDAQRMATNLAIEARQARTALERRIGPRGLTVGTLTVPGGDTFPIHLSDPENVKRLWRALPREMSLDRTARVATVTAVTAACDAWDKEAEKAGVRELERRTARAETLVRRFLQDITRPASAVS